MNWKHTSKPTLPPLGTPVMGMYDVSHARGEGKIDSIHAERTSFCVVMRGEDSPRGNVWYLPVTVNGKDQMTGGDPVEVPVPDSWVFLSELGLRTR